jgi:hypothetical protein
LAIVAGPVTGVARQVNDHRLHSRVLPGIGQMFNMPIAGAFFGGWPGRMVFDLTVSGPHHDMIGRDRQPGDQGFDTDSKGLGESDQSLQRR